MSVSVWSEFWRIFWQLSMSSSFCSVFWVSLALRYFYHPSGIFFLRNSHIVLPSGRLVVGEVTLLRLCHLAFLGVLTQSKFYFVDILMRQPFFVFVQGQTTSIYGRKILNIDIFLGEHPVPAYHGRAVCMMEGRTHRHPRRFWPLSTAPFLTRNYPPPSPRKVRTLSPFHGSNIPIWFCLFVFRSQKYKRMTLWYFSPARSRHTHEAWQLPRQSKSNGANIPWVVSTTNPFSTRVQI